MATQATVISMMHQANIWKDFEAVTEVLSARLPMLALTMADPTPARRLEAERMVLEKADAAVDGFISLQKYCFDAVFNAWSTPAGTDLVQGAFDAWMAPGRKTLRDNAERLRGESEL
jgi:hypothetical protein